MILSTLQQMQTEQFSNTHDRFWDEWNSKNAGSYIPHNAIPQILSSFRHIRPLLKCDFTELDATHTQ